MRKRNAIPTIFTLLLVAFFSGCEPGDDEAKEPTLSAEVDGQVVSVSFESAVLQLGTINGEPMRYLKIDATIGDESLNLKATGWDFNGHPDNGMLVKKYYTNLNALPETACVVHNATNHCENAIVTYVVGTDSYSSALKEGVEGYVEVTSCNSAKKRVSGKFYVQVFKNVLDDPGKIIEGEFQDLPYTIPH